MKITVALAVFLVFAVSAFGQAAQQSQPDQKPPDHTITVNANPAPRPHPGVKLEPIPNWPVNKPAPIILIPTQINPQAGLVDGAKPFIIAPVVPTRPCAIYVTNGRSYQFLEGTLPGSMKAQKRATSKDIDKIEQAGGDVKILDHSATPQEIETVRTTCSR